MSKTIPVTLLAHKAQSSTTLTDLLLIGPLDDASYRGLTLLDADVVYDGVTYKARTGMQMSAQSSTSDLGVDNAEADTLLPLADFPLEGFTQTQIDSGALDKVKFVVYRVDYTNPTEHEIVAGGTIGEVRTKVGGRTVMELRSLSQQLKQTVGELDSLTCRAKFGGQAGVAGVRANNACGFDLTAEWVSGTVLSIGAENDLIFTDTGLAQAADYFAPGVVEWLTGNNAGQQCEVDAFVSGVVTLQFPTVSPILLGDTYRIRRECSKRWTGHNSCETFWETAKTDHFRGEPWIPVADTGNLNSPGVAISRIGLSGTGEGGVISTPTAPESDPGTGGGDEGGITSGLTRTRGATVVNVSDYGAVGDGVTDDTAAFNAAYAALPGDGGTVEADAGTYLINPSVSVKPLDNTLLDLTSGAILKGKTNTTNGDVIVLVESVSNVEIAGGKITGDLDTFVPQSGTTSEHGYGVRFNGATACTLRDITIEKCVGDNVYVGSSSGHAVTTDIKIDNCILTNCRRNGISITDDVDDCQITRTEISYIGTTQGTAPKSGIDIEPIAGTASNILIDNCHIHHCVSMGVQARRYSSAVTVSNSLLEYNNGGLYTLASSGGTVSNTSFKHHRNAGIHLTQATDGYDIDSCIFFDNKIGSATANTTDTPLTTRTGESTATAKHINVDDGCTNITVGTSEFGP